MGFLLQLNNVLQCVETIDEVTGARIGEAKYADIEDRGLKPKNPYHNQWAYNNYQFYMQQKKNGLVNYSETDKN